jgi:hypothetical protein
MQINNQRIQQIENVIQALNAMVAKVQLSVFVTNALFVQITIYAKNVQQQVFMPNII